MTTSTLTAKGQTTLPKAVRDALALKPGDKVRYVIADNEVRIIKAKPLATLYGLLARPGQEPVGLEAMEEAIAAGAAERAGRRS
jgi:AbrB family looped-hinge helix DNA binding protein